ncbi:hypothetical protein QE152_g30472 [Popillia japonica]|uniref:Uncharacterized protein n=1 Tax=Popillia japonica TaxID=7064 RepID=A0AAW1JEH2_POPJA
MAEEDSGMILENLMNAIPTTGKKNQPLVVQKLIECAKARCYPDDSSITVTEVGVAIKLQSLLDHTADRLCLSQSSVIDNLTEKNLVLISKWGCDGSSEQSTFKQKFCNTDVSDSNLFMSSIVPLRLITHNNGIIVWKNPRPSSVRYCRPISFYFEKETNEFVNKIVNDIQTQISTLCPSFL